MYLIWFPPWFLTDQLGNNAGGKKKNVKKKSCFSWPSFSAEEETDLYINSLLYIPAQMALSQSSCGPPNIPALKPSSRLSHLGPPTALEAPCAFLPLCSAIFARLLCMGWPSFLVLLRNFCSSLNTQLSFCLLKTSLTCQVEQHDFSLVTWLHCYQPHHSGRGLSPLLRWGQAFRYFLFLCLQCPAVTDTY